MKLDELAKQATILSQTLPGRAERADQANEGQQAQQAQQAHADAKPKKAKDTVELSGLSPVAVDQRDQDVARAQRVEALKASVESGKYQVPAQAVAESMLSKIFGTGTNH